MTRIDVKFLHHVASKHIILLQFILHNFFFFFFNFPEYMCGTVKLPAWTYFNDSLSNIKFKINNEKGI